MAQYLLFFAAAGVPATGLTPAVSLWETDGSVVASPPAVSEVAGGFYAFTYTPAEDLVLVVDGTATLADAERYLHGLLTPRDASPTLVSSAAVPAGAAFSQLAAGNGIRQVTLAIDDGTDPVSGAQVAVVADGSSVLVVSGTTDSAGELTVALQDGAYDVRIVSPGYAFTVPENLTVTADATVTYSGSSAVVSSPSSPALCRMYLDVVDFDGSPREGVQLRVVNLFDNPGSSPVMVQSEQEYVSAANGRVTFDLPRGARVRVAVDFTPFQKEITVPNAATQDLAALLGDVADSFTVVG